MTHDLGIVLSGGGARGIAHIGVLEALREHGIEPDCVSGASSGAIVGALYCAGYDRDAMLEFFETRSPFRLSKIALGKPGIIDTDKVVANFRDHFPEDRFEALGKPLFVTATNLVEARSEVFSSGPLIAPILASSSFPGLFTPIEIDGHGYSDGGILCNFPLEPLEDCCRAILGVYASPLRSVARTDLDSMVDVMQRALEVGMYQTSECKFERCDAVVCPSELTAYGTLDTRQVREIYQVGYRATLERIDEIEVALRETLELD